ncbi:PRC-barrel domain-containing protein [Palleronia marisminoris]|uniref:PRC-barrel domain-containing protein n=1 Tax=Palleronia marisminoris TaxID=315423 RepID=UPI0008E20FFB|nr:PRC-barrel domain-containing protein [Palleronia marisminoris]SFH32761.1 PRC-barrel domain-containing protein [Palleronia marisminoris]
MFRRSLLAAASLAFAGPALSQEAGAVSSEQATPAPMEVVVADDLEDASIVSLEGSYDQAIWDETAPLEAMVADLNEIGRIEDVVLSAEGQMLGLTTDVGGFLGIGEKTVLIPLDDIRLIRTEDDDEVSVVTRLDQDALTDLPEVDLDD